MTTMHRLSRADFDSLASGMGDAEIIARLRSAEHSKHILLLLGVLDNAARTHPAAHRELELASGWRTLTLAQERASDAVTELLMLPHLGAWAVDCLLRMSAAKHDDPAVRADLAQFGTIAATAGLHARIAFELPVALRDGRLVLPGLGSLQTPLQCEYARLRHSAPGLALLTDDSVHSLPSSWPRPRRLAATHAGISLDVPVDATDPYLNRFGQRPLTSLDESTMATWRIRLAGAWRILATHHSGDAVAIAAGLRTVVPLDPEIATHTVSATSAAAFGALATSLPPDDITLAETLVHEFQHQKLCALGDLVSLTESGYDDLHYAPWRDDPRPLNGLLQGAYAYLGLTRFWCTHRLCVPPDQELRGHVEFARRRAETLGVTQTLLASGGLTRAGTRFVTRMRCRLLGWQREQVPTDAAWIADEMTADHAVTWRLRHLAADPDVVEQLEKAWRAGKDPGHTVFPPNALRLRPAGRSSPHVREILLGLRYKDPARFRRWLTQDRPAGPSGATEPTGLPDLSAGDLALLRGDSVPAITAYRSEIRDDTPIDANPARPEPWAGLALAVRRLLGGDAARVLVHHAPLLFALHAAIRRATGESPDPLRLSAWLTRGQVSYPGPP